MFKRALALACISEAKAIQAQEEKEQVEETDKEKGKERE
jgi:hypothetical protein